MEKLVEINFSKRGLHYYGDPIIASSSTINSEYKLASSTIAENTHNGKIEVIMWK